MAADKFIVTINVPTEKLEAICREKLEELQAARSRGEDVDVDAAIEGLKVRVAEIIRESNRRLFGSMKGAPRFPALRGTDGEEG